MGVILKILFFILKLLGILLLVILGVLLLVLLVPVRYEVVGEAGPEKKEASGHASWLLHLLHVGFAYREETFSYGIRVLGILVFPRKEKPPKETPAEEPETTEAAEEPIEAGGDGPVPLPGTGEEPAAEAQTDPADETARALGEQMREEQKKKPKKAAKETNTSRKETSTSRKETAAEILAILQDESYRETFRMALRQLGRILKHLLPRKVRIEGVFGFEDPSVTGQVLGVIAMLMPFYEEAIQVTPDFEQKRLEGKILLKGQLRLGFFVIVAVRLILDPNIRNLIRKIL